METPERAIREIARLITRGCTSGILDEEDGTRTSWKLETETWNDDKEEGEEKEKPC